MGVYLQVLALVFSGTILLWLGYTIFIGPLSPFYPGLFSLKGYGKKRQVTGLPGEPQICPLCSIKMDKGDLVRSLAFPSITGGSDRLMYIRGCFNCLGEENITRRCPVCGSYLNINDYLISRMFERVGRNNHVHVLGCNRCRRMGTLER
ncbi:MAG: hypothetical protein LBH16_07420 [Treponema sp.]|jgi:hypothetical protein|nr:hypothetical protein [Treponema sp.]